VSRIAAITGASAGIGRATAIAFGELGWTVAVGARRIEQLEETAKLVDGAGGRALVHTLDVSVDAFCEFATRDTGPIDVLVNNAATALPGDVHEMSDDDLRRIVETNLLGPVILSSRVVRALRTAGATTGDIVFISSDATVHPRPAMAPYVATKAGLEAFAATLALDLEGSGIRSSVVRVGPTQGTSFADGWDPHIFEDLFPRWQRFGLQRHFHTMQPEDIARAVVQVVTAPSHMWVPIVEVQPNPPRD
jgi:NAD(P)-dependent dehydrogenase (short-subunit alcohol dehydrogenase family)